MSEPVKLANVISEIMKDLEQKREAQMQAKRDYQDENEATTGEVSFTLDCRYPD